MNRDATPLREAINDYLDSLHCSVYGRAMSIQPATRPGGREETECRSDAVDFAEQLIIGVLAGPDDGAPDAIRLARAWGRGLDLLDPELDLLDPCIDEEGPS